MSRQVVRREEIGERWCFICRQRAQFYYLEDDMIELSYYSGRRPHIACNEGHEDGDLFPGRVREWEA